MMAKLYSKKYHLYVLKINEKKIKVMKIKKAISEKGKKDHEIEIVKNQKVNHNQHEKNEKMTTNKHAIHFVIIMQLIIRFQNIHSI